MNCLHSCRGCLLIRHIKAVDIIKLRYSQAVPKKTLLTYYQVLEVHQTATKEEIRDAYVRLSKQTHPDHNPDDPEKHEKFVRVSKAYNVLSKPMARKEYDASLNYRMYTGHMHPPDSHIRHQPESSFARETYRSDFPGYNEFKSYQHVSWETFNREQEKNADDYYGIKGIPRQSNFVVLSFCMFLLVCGTISLYLAFSYSGKKRRDYIELVGKQNLAMYNQARENAKNYTTSEILQRLERRERGRSHPDIEIVPAEITEKPCNTTTR